MNVLAEQVLAKATWLAGEVGVKETEDDRIEKYILTKFPDAKFTPVGKGGLKLDFGPNKPPEIQEVVVQEDSDETESSEEESE